MINKNLITFEKPEEINVIKVYHTTQGDKEFLGLVRKIDNELVFNNDVIGSIHFKSNCDIEIIKSNLVTFFDKNKTLLESAENEDEPDNDDDEEQE